MAKKKTRHAATADHTGELTLLLEQHGIGCPKAVQLGGPGVVGNWIEEQWANIELTASATAAEDVEDEVAEEDAEVAVQEVMQQLQDHDEQISGLNAALGVPDPDTGNVYERLVDLEHRLDAQESQGIDQWRGIEANTAGRIELTKAVEKRKGPRRPSDGKPRGKKA